MACRASPRRCRRHPTNVGHKWRSHRRRYVIALDMSSAVGMSSHWTCRRPSSSLHRLMASASSAPPSRHLQSSTPPSPLVRCFKWHRSEGHVFFKIERIGPRGSWHCRHRCGAALQGEVFILFFYYQKCVPCHGFVPLSKRFQNRFDRSLFMSNGLLKCQWL